jgi:hypothetical protein
MKKFLNSVFIFLMLFLPLTGWAHPGHGESDGFTLIHYFREPLHALVSLGILATLFVSLTRRSGNKAQQERI